MRKIVVAGVEYQYKVGSGTVKIVGPHSSVAVEIPVIKGSTWDIFERGQWKRTSDGMVRPAEIAAYIQRVFR